jgi:DNA topoisomerase-1
MAKKAHSGNGKALVIVESPAKARTISKFLGRGYTVEASIGHVRDLPEGKKDVPQQYKDRSWARLGVDVENDFTPIYIVPAEKKKQVTKLKGLLKQADALFLATDEDREGEAISWHLEQILKPKVPVHRMVFHEITKEAIDAALANPRQIDEGLVRAQEARRILDRLYGYEVSELLWRKIGSPGGRRLSAGRVQSVAVRMIVERERERCEFTSATYWDLLAKFATDKGEEFQAELVSVDGRKIPAGRDFDPATGKLKNDELLHLDAQGAKQLAERLRQADFKITSLEVKPFTEKPKPPFTTSTLQQEANRKLGFTARRTMSTAQSLYENGHITYMRTDSTKLAKEAVEAARDLVMSEYGNEYLPETPRVHTSKEKNAQEAHEAIRPAGHPFELPEAIRSELTPDGFRLFELIWKRTIASQMSDARKRRITITIEGGGAVFQVSGTTIEFEGFLRAYVEGSDDPAAELADKETLLPAVQEGQSVECRDLQTTSHTTQPPARYTEASLTRKLEQEGIGRPSTYASIIDTIQARDYVFKKGNALVPTWVAFCVVRFLKVHLGKLVDYEFTAEMEDLLDAISRHEQQPENYLRSFYFGNGQPGLKNTVEDKKQSADIREIARFHIGTPTEGEHTEPVYLRVGRYGPFLEQGDRKGSVPDGMAPDELTLEKSLELIEQGQKAEEPLGEDPQTGRPVYIKTGRFGPYVQLGPLDDKEKPKNSSLLKGMTIDDIDLETALKLLSLPRELGEHPENGEKIVAHNGRYGPYVKCGSETRSLPAEMSPLEVTLDQAVHLLAQPKTRRGRAAPKEPLKTFDNSPVTEEPVKLLDGRYGPYVTDGETNASLPRDASPEELTFEQALALLAERKAAGGGRKKKKAKKKATKKKAAKKKAAKKKPAKKKTAAKKKA